MSDTTDTHDEAAAEQPAAETPFPPRHFDAEEHLVNGSTDVTQQSPTMRLVPALADTTPEPLTSEQIAAGEQAALEVFGGAPAPLELRTPAEVVAALGVPAGPPGDDAAATALALLEQPPAPSVVVITAGIDQIAPRPDPACDDSPDCRCPACVGAQIATHGHAFASPR